MPWLAKSTDTNPLNKEIIEESTVVYPAAAAERFKVFEQGNGRSEGRNGGDVWYTAGMGMLLVKRRSVSSLPLR